MKKISALVSPSYIIVILSLCFVAISFFPCVYEIKQSVYLPEERYFLLEHNYLFDYNFYLSRIRQGYDGNWLVRERYFNHAHTPSLFQVVYLWAGNIGGWMGMSVPMIYHSMRIISGFGLLYVVGYVCAQMFPGGWSVLAFVSTVMLGSWPVLFPGDHVWRVGTHMGWWSVIDSLQRMTTLPHVLIGQICLVLFLWRYCGSERQKNVGKSVLWGIVGCIGGIIFPPTLIVVYMVFVIHSLFELICTDAGKTVSHVRKWLRETIWERLIFCLLSAPSLLYAHWMFGVMPWKALALFDIEHRIPLPYAEYRDALGPMLYLGIVGAVLMVFRREKVFLFLVSWMVSIGSLFLIFEYIPTQSPLRFTESLLHVPLGICTTYLLFRLWKWGRYGMRGVVVCMYIFLFLFSAWVMGSMVFWKMDEAVAKRYGTWPVPIGNQLAYPLKDFMQGIFFLRDHVSHDAVVLSYVTAGNYIPAYAGQPVYIGHANTPYEDKKEPIAADFFSGQEVDRVKKFLQDENITHIFFGPQERAYTGKDLSEVYSFLQEIYTNSAVVIYKVSLP